MILRLPLEGSLTAELGEKISERSIQVQTSALRSNLGKREEMSGMRHSESRFDSSATVELKGDVLPTFETFSLASSLSLVNAMVCGEH